MIMQTWLFLIFNEKNEEEKRNFNFFVEMVTNFKLHVFKIKEKQNPDFEKIFIKKKGRNDLFCDDLYIYIVDWLNHDNCCKHSFAFNVKPSQN